MLRTTTRIITALTATTGLIASGAMLSAASATCDSTGNCGDQSSSGHQIGVQVSGSFSTGGSPGSDGGSSSSVTVYSPCEMSPLVTGKEMAEGYEKWGNTGHGPNGVKSKPPKDLDKHANDDKGQWYGPSCYMGNPKYEKFVNEFFKRGMQFVEANEQPPVPPVPPEVLLEAAQKAMVIPKPVFEQNPHAKGGNNTIVKVPTWFWMRPGVARQGQVTATAGANSATVEMHLSDVEYSSPIAGAVPCADGGTPYSRGATSNCTLTFPQAATGTPVTATARWEGSWTFNGAPQGAIDPIQSEWETALNVLEVQSLVTEVG